MVGIGTKSTMSLLELERLYEAEAIRATLASKGFQAVVERAT